MATPIIRTSYALDQETVDRLDRLAQGYKAAACSLQSAMAAAAVWARGASIR